MKQRGKSVLEDLDWCTGDKEGKMEGKGREVSLYLVNSNHAEMTYALQITFLVLSF